MLWRAGDHQVSRCPVKARLGMGETCSFHPGDRFGWSMHTAMAAQASGFLEACVTSSRMMIAPASGVTGSGSILVPADRYTTSQCSARLWPGLGAT